MKLEEPQRPAREFQPYLVAEIIVDEADFADEPVTIPESVSEAAAEKKRTTHRGRPAKKLSETEPQDTPEAADETDDQQNIDDASASTESESSADEPAQDSKPKKKRRGRRGRRNRSKNNTDKPSGGS